MDWNGREAVGNTHGFFICWRLAQSSNEHFFSGGDDSWIVSSVGFNPRVKFILEITLAQSGIGPGWLTDINASIV
jgi:hypothetical protein